MPRFVLSALLPCLFFGVVFAFAQEQAPETLKTAPAVLRQVAEARKAIDLLPADQRLEALFQLLSLQINFADKVPAQETISAILDFVAPLDKELTRQQALEVVVYTQAELGEFDAALATAEKISKPESRAEVLLAVAESMMENEDRKADAQSVLRKAVADAVTAKNAALEALSRTLLARELAPADKPNAAALFQEARKKAHELEAVEERNVVSLLIRNEIEAGMIDEALAVIETVGDEDMRRAVTGYAAVVLTKEGKKAEAEKLLAALKSDDVRGSNVRDNVLVGIVRETAETITLDEILKLATEFDSPERKDFFFQEAISSMLDADRYELAQELAEQMQDSEEIESGLAMWLVQTLLDDQKFDEAQKLIDAFEDTPAKQHATRSVLLGRLQNGMAPEEVQKLADATLSAEEKQQKAQIQEEINKALEIESPEERVAALSEMMPSMFDFLGLKKTLDSVLQAVEELSDPVAVVAYRLEFAMIQQYLNDKAGLQKNLSALLSFMDGIEDIKTLENLVPEPEASHTPDAPVAAQKPVTEADIKNRLFEIYCNVATLLNETDDADGTKMALAAAQKLADAESVPMKKAGKMLMLTQLAAFFAGNFEK